MRTAAEKLCRFRLPFFLSLADDEACLLVCLSVSLFLSLFLTLRSTTPASGKSEGISCLPHISRLRLCPPLKKKKKGKNNISRKCRFVPSYGAFNFYDFLAAVAARPGNRCVKTASVYFHSYRLCRRDNSRVYKAMHTIPLHNDKLFQDLFPDNDAFSRIRIISCRYLNAVSVPVILLFRVLLLEGANTASTTMT